jgi:formate/nitrite transporter
MGQNERVNDLRIDALLPAEMARRAEYLGVRKIETPALSLFALAVLAGAFIALGAVFATTVAAGTVAAWPYGVARLLTGLVFCLGLVLVVVGGAELFTGNSLIVMAWASRKVTTRAMLHNWLIVYLGNFVGAVATAAMVVVAGHQTFGDGAVGQAALAIARAKTSLGFVQAIALGVLCNALVCLAVWLTFSARSAVDKIAAIIFPITAFVAAGFEHCVANMYFVPVAIFIQDFAPGFPASSAPLTWGGFLLGNLLPVTIGNVIGGSVLVAAVYWAVYLRRSEMQRGSESGELGRRG